MTGRNDVRGRFPWSAITPSPAGLAAAWWDRGLRAALALALLGGGAGCFVPLVIPPARLRAGIEVPRQRDLDGDKHLVGATAVGAHLASLRETPIDAGLGLVTSPRRNGVYLEVAKLFRNDAHSRWGITGAYEHWWEHEGPRGDGVRVGLSFEGLTSHLKGSGGGSGSDSVAWWGAYGFLGLGVYADAGYRHLYDGTDELTVTAGISFTVPLLGLVAAIR